MKKASAFLLILCILLTFLQLGQAAQDDRTLSDLIGKGSRTAFRAWADQVSVARLNQEVAALSDAQRANLCAMLLDSRAEGEDRSMLLGLMDAILAKPGLGFYAQVFSYTSINLEGEGYYYWGGGRVTLKRGGFLSMKYHEKRNTLMHECFHSFNDHNGGPDGALNEGAAIWVFKKAFGVSYAAEDWAEATYGTKLYYKTYMNQLDYPLQAPAAPSDKLLEVYAWLSEGDKSRLPWWDDALLNEMYQRHYAGLKRDVDFYSVWLPSLDTARENMLSDPLMNAPDRLQMPRAGN